MWFKTQSPFSSVLDFWKIKFEKSSLKNQVSMVKKNSFSKTFMYIVYIATIMPRLAA